MGSMVIAQFVDQDGADMFVPQAGCFRVSLEVTTDWDYPAFGYGRATKMIDPPIEELIINFHEKWFLGWGCLGKCIGDIAADCYIIDGGVYCPG